MYAHVRTRNDVLKPHIRTQYMVVPDNKQFRCVRFYVQKVCSCAFLREIIKSQQLTFSHIFPSTAIMTETITSDQKQLLQRTTLSNGMNAWEFVLTRPKDGQYWTAVGILSCMRKCYGLNLLEIGWEARDLRYAKNPGV